MASGLLGFLPRNLAVGTTGFRTDFSTNLATSVSQAFFPVFFSTMILRVLLGASKPRSHLCERSDVLSRHSTDPSWEAARV